jgi:hypothetical protein
VVLQQFGAGEFRKFRLGGYHIVLVSVSTMFDESARVVAGAWHARWDRQIRK